MTPPAVVERYRKVCALQASPEPGERATATRMKERMEAEYPGIQSEAFPPRGPEMSTKPFSVDDLLRTATSPEFAGAIKAMAEAMNAQPRTNAAPAHIEKVAGRFDVEANYDEEEGEFAITLVWSERTMDKILDTVAAEETSVLAEVVLREVRAELLKMLFAARRSFSG